MPEGPSRGDIYLADLTPGAVGSEQQGTRPVAIVSNDIANAFASVVIVAAVTSQPSKRRQLWDVILPAGQPLPLAGRIMCNQLFSLDKDERLIKKMGSLSAAQLVDLDQALRVSLGLDGMVPSAP